MNSNADIITQNSAISFDTISPYNYNEWILQNSRVIPEDSLEKYNQYIYNWYKVNAPTSNAYRIKTDYINLLRELTLFFTEDEKNLFFTDINFNDDVDIIYAIPFFVKKLKSIALTIASRREGVKDTKFKYNLIGSALGLEAILYQSILKAFTSTDNLTQLSINTLGTAFPELSAVKDNLIIELEELYDPAVYAEEDYESSSSTTAPRIYNNPLFNVFETFLQQFNNNTLSLSAFNNYTLNSTPKIYNEINLNIKYLGNSLYTLSGSQVPALAVLPDAPYLNLTNTHFANIATTPSLLNFISKQGVGGYLLPHRLGVPYYLGHGYTNKLSNTNFDKNSFFLNPDIYTSNRGLTKKDQPSPYETTHIDNTWIRENKFAGQKSGTIINSINYQKFVPYQSSYETLKTNIYGVSRQEDVFDFWSGPNNNIWNDEINHSSNYKKENNKINERASKLIVTNKISCNWTTDIFGNNYIILKDPSSSISFQRENVGELWVRDVYNTVNTGNNILNSIYNIHINSSDHYQNLAQNRIIQIDIFEDAMLLRTKNGISINKFTYDFLDRKFINSNVLQSFIPCGSSPLTPNQGILYGGHWYDESTKTVYINTVKISNSGSTTQFLYSIHKYTTASGELSLYLQDTIISAVFIDLFGKIKQPATFKYNSDNNTFNTSFIFNKFDIYSIDINNLKDNPYISSVTLIN